MYCYRMIAVSTLYKSTLVYSHSSSFHFLPSPTIILTRSFCTVQCSLVQLSADIDFLYKSLTDNLPFSMSRYRLALIQ